MDDSVAQKPIIVVGVGASAGGLEALELMFDNVSLTSDMAFVVVQHLSPDFRSLMDELLARHTCLTIHKVEHGMRVEPNAIYLMPPKKEMIISNGCLLLSDKDQNAQFTLPIDVFFRSLAQECKSSAVGIVLSGTGSDGSAGVVKIHEAGGLVIAQSEESSQFNGMPRSAIETGMVDIVVPPEKIGSLLSRFAVSPNRAEFLAEVNSLAEAEPILQTIFASLRKEYGVDFLQYKPGTMLRRLNRRSQLARCESIDEYAQLIAHDAGERLALYEDLLIGVTQFFRDPEMFKTLRKVIKERLLTSWKDEVLRLWVCGCSTGQEAYTLAIIVRELLEETGKHCEVKLFATDIDRDSVDFASKGLYNRESMNDVPEELVAKYFTETPQGFQIVPEIRQSITFAKHNALRDAPFTSIHLITCRNLLIYLNNEAQQKVLSLLYFGLKFRGLLFLGSSEYPGEIASEINTVDAGAKIYEKASTTKVLSYRRTQDDVLALALPSPPSVRHKSSGSSSGFIGSSKLNPELINVYDMLLGELVSAAVLIDREDLVVHVFGEAARYLTIPTGRVTAKLMDLTREEMHLAITGAVHRVRKTNSPVRIPRLRVTVGGAEELISLTASVLKTKSGQTYVLIRFEPAELPAATPLMANETAGSLMESAAEHIDELSIELNYTKENLTAAIEELETSNEELQATNEEMVAANEELQSTNEELHSVNEELYTVNAEFQKKIAELTKLNNDFDNLLSSTDIHTVFLDQLLCIRFFTPKSIEIFNFSHEDIGRKFDSFTHKLHLPSLMLDLNQVLLTGQMIEREVIDQRGIAFLTRLLPYVVSGKFSGVVISLLDISARVEWELQLQNSNERFERAIAATRDGIWDWPTVGEDAMWWSPLCYELLGYENSEFPCTHSNWLSLIHPDDRERIKQRSVPFQQQCFVELHRSFEYRMLHKSGEYRWFQHRAICEHDAAGKLVKMTGSISDIQDRKSLEESLRDQVRQRDDFLAILSHELRNPLGAVTNALRLINMPGRTAQQCDSAMEVIRDQSQHMSRLLDDLLDVSRVTHNKLEMRMTEFNLLESAQEVTDSVKSRAETHGIELRFAHSASPLFVRADRDRILQCQVNLLGNAIKFTPRGGFVEYSMRADGNMACIQVKDSGVGMSQELCGRIFELFAQGENEPRAGDSGIGVGLALVRAIAELHGGSVSAHSDGLGKGSTFTLRIPLATATRSNDWLLPDATVASDTPPDRFPTKRVLIIDDLDEGRSMLAQVLSLEGHEVAEAENGLSGLTLATSGNFDVALIDLGLPDISGHEVARRIRADPQIQTLLLIALTGYGQEKDLSDSREAGFNYHLTKPLDVERLLRLLE